MYVLISFCLPSELCCLCSFSRRYSFQTPALFVLEMRNMYQTLGDVSFITGSHCPTSISSPETDRYGREYCLWLTRCHKRSLWMWVRLIPGTDKAEPSLFPLWLCSVSTLRRCKNQMIWVMKVLKLDAFFFKCHAQTCSRLRGWMEYLRVRVSKEGETVIGNHLEGGNEAPHQSHGVR